MEAANSQLFPMVSNDDALRGVEPRAAAADLDPRIREQLVRILRSSIFASSTRLVRFLRFVVETTLEGRAGYLKEYVIGTEVYDRKPPYEPSQDSIVRTEARRLRTKLKEYYESEGKKDPILISFRIGSYVPVFAPLELLKLDSPRKDLPVEGISSGLAKMLIAVMPFEDLSGDLLAKDFGHAIADSLSHHLMMIEGCRVIGAESANNLASTLQEPSRVNHANGIHFVFLGTVARSEQCLRVTSRLADPNGFQLWSIQFDLEADRKHLFRLTNQIASTLTSRMHIQDLCSRASTSEERPNRYSIDSSILTAEHLMEQDSPFDWPSVQARFETVLRAAPRHIRAHVGVAHCLVEFAISGVSGSSDAVSNAKRAVLRALELDSRHSSAHACLGFVLALEHDAAAAQRSFERSSILGPEATGHRQYALLLTALGRFEDAWHHLQKAQTIDPFSSRQKIARSRILYLSRRFEELIQEHKGLPIYGFRPSESQVFAALAHLELGQFEEARQLARCIRRDMRAHPGLMAAAAEIFARCGDFPVAMEIAEHFKLFSHESPISSLRQALLAIALGDQRGAISALIASYEKREAEVLWLRVDPRFDVIRSSPCARSLDAWHRVRSSKETDSGTLPTFPRHSCLDQFVEEPRVA